MKKALWILSFGFLILSPPAQAFWTNADNLIRNSQTIRADHRGGQTEVTIDEVITNNQDEAQTYRYLFPYEKTVSSLNLYRDGNGLNYEKQSGPTLLETLWEFEQRDLLQLGVYHDQAVLVSAPMVLAPGENLDLKLKYRLTPETIEATELITIDIADRLPSEALEISFNLAETAQHFLPPAHLSGDVLRENNQATWLHQSSETIQTEPLTFIWSNQAQPSLTYRYLDYDYRLQLTTPPAPMDWQTATILVDQSGSMFGARWQHSQRLVREFLKNLSPNTKFRVGFFDDEVSWFHEMAVPNSASEQKKLFDWWESQVPTGRTDWSLLQSVLKNLQLDQSALSKSAGLIIGDFSQFELPETEHLNLKSFRRSLLLDFAENETASFWARFNDGQYQPLLSEDEDLQQWPFIWQDWQSLHLAQNPPTGNNTLPAEINYFPPQQSLVWLSRDLPTGVPSLSRSLSFIPRLWAERRAASDLRRLAITSLDDGKKLILHALVRGLGVSQPPINPQLEKNPLFESLEGLPARELWTLIWQLEAWHSPVNNLFFQAGKPLYLTDNQTWTSGDFANDFGIKSGLKIQPNSEAERQLFYFFPDLLSQPLSLGERVDYCGERRCIQLIENGESEAKETHKLDWRAYLKPHWANSFALELAQENTVKIDPFGDLQLDKPVTRGDFILWLTEWYFGSDFTERTAEIQDPRFRDIQDESTKMAEAIYLLRRKGVIQGYGDGTVRPDQTLTRAEAVKIILALDGYQPRGDVDLDNLPFRDINGWEQAWVIQAQKTGLVQGYGDGTFRPNQPLTRGEGMKLVVSF